MLTSAIQYRRPFRFLRILLAITIASAFIGWRFVEWETPTPDSVPAPAPVIRPPNAQLSTAIGTHHDVELDATTELIWWTGASDVTFTGFTGSDSDNNRILIVENRSRGRTLTLSNQDIDSLAADRLWHPGELNVALVGTGSSATYLYDAKSKRWRIIATRPPQDQQAPIDASQGNALRWNGMGMLATTIFFSLAAILAVVNLLRDDARRGWLDLLMVAMFVAAALCALTGCAS